MAHKPMVESDSSTIKQWYVVQIHTGKENKVVEALRVNIATKKMEEKFGEILVPTEEVVEMKAGQKYKSKKKFYPGYILVEMIMDAQTWHLVKETSGVVNFIGGKHPAPLPESEIKSTLQRVSEGVKKPRPKILYEIGEVVRIISGPFVDFNGVVEDVNYEKNRLRVSVLIFGRSTPVELEFSQVEKVS